MQKTRRVLNVFLASPTDVAKERVIAEEVVISVNKLIGRNLGWHIELQKWEDTGPGYGRPQALINPMVDECDIFVGLLWERWGQPSGAHSSGFEEEFERARERRKRTGEPRIWLVFKEVGVDKLKDPGEQLKKVVEFRAMQEALQEVLFKNIRHSDDWRTNLQSWLLEHILRLTQLSQTGEQRPVGVVPAFEPPDTSSIASSEPGGNVTAMPQQLMALSRVLSRSLETGALGFSATPESPLREFDVARLFLLSATLVFHRYTRDVLGIHETNLLYKHRDQLDATPAEEFQLFRAIVESTGDIKPGWFWFRDMAKGTVPAALFSLVARDGSESVRTGALTLLTTAGIKIPQEWWPSLPLDDDSFGIRGAAFDYIGSLADWDALSFLEKLTPDDDPNLSSSIGNARLGILTNLDPDAAFSEVVMKDMYLSAPQLNSLSARISQVGKEALLGGTGSSSEQIRKLSLEELIRRGSLPLPLADKLTTDPSVAVRAICFSFLAAKGELPDVSALRTALQDGPKNLIAMFSEDVLSSAKPYQDANSIIAKFYSTRSTEELLNTVDWFSLDGHLAYRALAVGQCESVSVDIRSDLRSGFKRIKDESLRRYEKALGDNWAENCASWDKLDDFIRSQYTEAALLGLEKNTQPSDADLARPYLAQPSHPFVNPAVMIVGKVGTSEDTAALLTVAKEAHGSVRIDAARAALKLSTDPLAVATSLLLDKSSHLKRVGYDWMLAHESDHVMEFFKTMLTDESESNRLMALNYVSNRLRRAELEVLLNEYIRKETYYYNVVVWLDRLLYSPSPLREMFVRELEKKFT